MYSDAYITQFQLLLETLPSLSGQNIFALKGGTAINLFYTDLPRVSVDIDLTYLPIEGRDETIKNINEGLKSLEERIYQLLPDAEVTRQLSKSGMHIIRLRVSNSSSTIKIEPNFILRGSVESASNLDVSSKVSDEFGMSVSSIPVLSFNDVYAGKICAALSRQHPRDLFDIMILLSQNGLNDSLRKTFLVYLVCNSRPINELLNPNLLDIKALYEKEFENMTKEPVTLSMLLDARQSLITKLKQDLTDDEKCFLLSIKKGEPNYDLLPFDGIENLPALKWKLQNIKKMSKPKHQAMLKKLEKTINAN